MTSHHYVVVIAHPDDEVMFFLPFLTSIQARKPRPSVSLLCLSSGNANGLGSIRVHELEKSCRFLGITDFSCLDCTDLQDGMNVQWDTKIVADQIAQFLCTGSSLATNSNPVQFVTFDDYGVSGHINHQAVFRGAKSLVENPTSYGLAKWSLSGSKLISTNIFRKYVGPLDMIWSLLFWLIFGGELFFQFDPLFNYSAMQNHYSQFVWFRRLFVIFSSYSFVNTLVKM